MYDTKCALYTFLSFLPFLISLYYLKLAHEARPKGKKSKFYWFPFYPHKANMNEKMIFLNMQFSVFLCIVASDIECLAYRLDFESSRSFFMALLQFSPTHVGILLVTAWITIIDGGKNKTTPKWCRNLEIAVVFYGYVVTTFLSIIGYHICLTDNDIPLDQGACEYNHYPSEDGIISGVKKLVYITIFATYGTLSGVYGAKISYQLRSGKGKKASPEEKKIKRWCYTLCVLFVFGVWGNTQAMGPRWGRTIKIPAFCEMDWTTPFIQINLIQWGIVYAMQPMKKGKKLTTHIVSSAFAKFRSTDASDHICLTDNDIPLDQGACEYNHYPSEDGIISGVKKLVYITIFATYGTLSGVYGAKISYQLRSGKGKKASPEEKKIKRWCYTLCVLFVFGVWGNTQAMGPRWGRTIKIPAFCEMDWTTPFIQINLIQWGIVYAMQPMKKGKKLTTHIVSSAFAKFRSTDASGRKRSKSSKSRSSTKTAGDSSTNGSSTRSSSNNSSANSSKTSSLLSSVKSASSSSSTSGSSSMGSEGSNSSSVAFESEMTSSFASESDSSFASEMGGSAFESVADGSAFEPEEEPVAVAPYGNKVAPE